MCLLSNYVTVEITATTSTRPAKSVILLRSQWTRAPRGTDLLSESKLSRQPQRTTWFTPTHNNNPAHPASRRPTPAQARDGCYGAISYHPRCPSLQGFFPVWRSLSLPPPGNPLLPSRWCRTGGGPRPPCRRLALARHSRRQCLDRLYSSWSSLIQRGVILMTGTPYQPLSARVLPVSEPPQSLPQAGKSSAPPPQALLGMPNVSLTIPPAKKPGRASLYASLPRCSEKGCVFPVAGPGASQCRHHDRQYREPALFRSHQPSMLLLDRAKFGVAAGEEEARPDDRRRLSKLWETFIEGAA